MLLTKSIFINSDEGVSFFYVVHSSFSVLASICIMCMSFPLPICAPLVCTTIVTSAVIIIIHLSRPCKHLTALVSILHTK